MPVFISVLNNIVQMNLWGKILDKDIPLKKDHKIPGLLNGENRKNWSRSGTLKMPILLNNVDKYGLLSNVFILEQK